MKQVADLLTVMHDIDRLKGRSCGSCKFWSIDLLWENRCAKGMMPPDAGDVCPNWRDKHADRNAKLTALVVGSLCLMVAVLPMPAKAFDGKKWAQVDPDTREWFRGLRSPSGFPCCDFADGNRIDDPDWRGPAEDGSYEVKWRQEWLHVDKSRVLTGSNRVGYAILWKNPSVDQPYCFLPGAGG